MPFPHKNKDTMKFWFDDFQKKSNIIIAIINGTFSTRFPQIFKTVNVKTFADNFINTLEKYIKSEKTILGLLKTTTTMCMKCHKER